MNLTDDKGHKYDSVGPIWMGQRLNSSESPGAYQRLVYGKGGAVLHMLRMMLINPRDPQDPEARFKTMMKEFTSKFDNAAASTEDFKAVAEKHMLPDMNLDGNGRLDWFFNQYVYGTGLPTYEFKYTLNDAGGGQWKLNGTVTQSGVPRGWKDVLPIYMEVNQNLFRVGTVNVMQPVVTIEETMPFKPTKVVLCANADTIGFVKQ
jgi:aminopeptidase N